MKRYRHKIGVGSIVEIVALKKTADSSGRECWKSTLGMIDTVNGKPICYEYILLKSYQMGNLKDGEQIVISKINSYHSDKAYNSNGGMSIYRTLEIEYVKVGEDENDNQ